MNQTKTRCGYTTLGQYQPKSDIPGHSANSGFVVVPDYQTAGYNTLTSGDSSCGYRTVISAYGKGAERCGPEFRKSCNQ